MQRLLRSAGAFAAQSALSLVVLQFAAIDGAHIAHAQANEQERARAAQQRAAQQAAAQQQRAAQAQAAQQRAAQQRAAQQAAVQQQRAAQAQAAQQRAVQQRAAQQAAAQQQRAAEAQAAQQRAAQQRAAQAAQQQRAAQEQVRAQQRAAQAQAAQQRAAQQRAAQEQARAAQQRAGQEQARAAQQRAAQEQARAAQQRAGQEQAAAAQQRAAQDQARAAQQRAAQEQARAAQQRAGQEQAGAAQQRAAQDQARAAQQRAAQEHGRTAQQRAAQEQMRQKQRDMREQQRAAREQARAQQRAAQEQARAAAQSRRTTAPLGQSGQSGAEQNRPILGQERQTALEARGRREEVPSQRLREVQRQRQEQRQADRVVIREPDRRSIIRQNQHAFIRHDDNQRLARMVRAAQTARRGDTTALSFSSRNGARVFSEVDKEGHALRRYRRGRDGREIVLFDDRPFYAAGLGASFVDLSPPVYELPPEQYVIDYSTASEDEIYTALTAPPIEPLARSYALEEIRQGYQLRERMRRIELVDINFEAGSWEIAPEQYPKLERLARALNHILQEHPDEVFLIEGHADVLDSDIDNLTLSDRRAEAVAFILSQMFAVPAENLVTQGYGDEFLKADAGKINRRVSMRRITPLLRPQTAAVATSQPDALPAPAPAALDLSEDDRAFIAENLNYATEPGLGIGGISEGIRVPGGARLRSFPSIIRDRLPALATYRYFVSENEIAVVDPTRAEVVAVIEANR